MSGLEADFGAFDEWHFKLGFPTDMIQCSHDRDLTEINAQLRTWRLTWGELLGVCAVIISPIRGRPNKSIRNLVWYIGYNVFAPAYLNKLSFNRFQHWPKLGGMLNSNKFLEAALSDRRARWASDVTGHSEIIGAENILTLGRWLIR